MKLGESVDGALRSARRTRPVRFPVLSRSLPSPFGLLWCSFGAPLNPFIPAVRHWTRARCLLS